MTPAAKPRRFAPAKLNLFLHVGAKRPDGYHELATLVVFADVGDELEAREAKSLTLTLQGPFGEALRAEPHNLVLKAARELDVWAEERGHRIQPVEIILKKNLPIASGIGGGSSDAAAALQMLATLWSLPIPFGELEAIAKTLGADVPVCLRSRPTMVTGMGEVLAPAPDLPPFALVLVNPRVEVPTRRVFETLDVRSGAFAPPLPKQIPTARDLAMLLDRTTNDLAPPAKTIAPVIMHAESALARTEGCLIARMSGSGATCFGLYDSAAAARAAAAAIAKAHPAWWVKPAGSYASP